MIPGYKVLSLLASKSSWSKRVSKAENKQTGKIKIREQFRPNRFLQMIHRHSEVAIKEKLSQFNIQFKSATGFIKGGGMHKHYMRHVNKAGYFNQYWFVTDLKNAYQTVDAYTLASIICQLFIIDPNPHLKNSEEWQICEDFFKSSSVPIQYKSQYELRDMMAFLSDFFLNPETGKGLAEGYSLSPFLFNLYAEIMLDRKMRNVCERYKITYSRFADDLIFTSEELIGKVKKKKIKEIISEVFAINQVKTMYFDIDRFPQGVVLNNCVVRNTRGQAEVAMLGKDQRKFKRMLYFAHQNDEANLSVLAGNYGTFSQKTRFFGGREPYLSRNTKQIVQLFQGYVRFVHEG